MNGDRVSLYVHIPLCTKKCDYCHFYVVPDKDIFKEKLKEGLIREWEQIRSHFVDKEIVSVYFGGGTPSLLPPDFYGDFLSTLPLAHAEVTLEANPESVDVETMRRYREAGINRVSLGVQSFNDSELHTLSRGHGSALAHDAVEHIKSAGIENISIDLMYDTPGQTMLSWERTLNLAAKLPITHLSLYNLTFEPHTVFFKKQDVLKKALPTEDDSFLMYKRAQEVLSSAGLNQYEISAFAKPGYTARHNVGYWTGRSFWGIGPSAFSYWDNKRFQNVPNINRWHEAVMSGRSAVGFSEELEEEATRREALMLSLRLLEGVPEKRAVGVEIERLIDEGLLVRDGGYVRMSERGVLLYDFIAREIVAE